MNDIKAILFDFMGVLLFKRSDYLSDPLVDAIDKEMGQVTDEIVFKQKMLSEHNLSEAEFEQVTKKIGEKYEANQVLWKLLPELRKKYKLGIVNNGAILTLPMFEAEYGIKSKFDLYVNSAIEGIKKPDPRIFMIAVERLGINQSECLYMDDLIVNVEAAEKLGMKVICWDNKEQGMKKFLEFVGG